MDDFYEFSFIGEVVVSFCGQMAPAFSPLMADIVLFVLMIYGAAITVWCIVKLKALPSDVTSTPVSADL